MMPNWVAKDPGKLIGRWRHECGQLKDYPNFEQVIEEDGTHYIEGYLITNSKNIYRCRICYSANYPYEKPRSIVLDEDVVQTCLTNGVHNYHNHGRDGDGIRLCIFLEDSAQGLGWKPYYSIISLIIWTAEWLHAYEVKKETAIWILPE